MTEGLPVLQVNVSGGRTSMYMAAWLKHNYAHIYDLVFIFANTGFEHADTYRFLEAGDKHFELGLVKVECVVHEGRKGSTHKVVSYEALAKNGEPFEAEISKYGISNVSFKHCNREMKFNPMKSYMRENYKNRDITLALGIRPDETRRVSKTASDQRIVYPLVHWHPEYPDFPDKEFIVDYFKQFEWDLKIPEYLGNCITCYKKSEKKLNMVYRDNPHYFDFFKKMEEQYGWVKPKSDRTPGPRRWFRGYKSTDDLIALFDTLNADTSRMLSDDSGGCSESCEIFDMSDQLD